MIVSLKRSCYHSAKTEPSMIIGVFFFEKVYYASLSLSGLTIAAQPRSQPSARAPGQPKVSLGPPEHHTPTATTWLNFSDHLREASPLPCAVLVTRPVPGPRPELQGLPCGRVHGLDWKSQPPKPRKVQVVVWFPGSHPIDFGYQLLQTLCYFTSTL